MMSNLAKIAPIVRGLLAEPTDNQDMPYKPVILKSLTSKEAVDFAGSEKNAEAQQYPAPLTKGKNPPLFLDPIDENIEQEELRKKIDADISEYSKRHGCKPEIV